jgi:UDP-2,3-diacylglucosamine pyrophosphatase LpxH
MHSQFAYKYIIASDLHLGMKDSKGKQFIEFVKKHPAEILILNGDIIDGWALNRGRNLNASDKAVISFLLNYSTDHKIIWIMGNHDEFLEPYLGHTISNISIQREYILQLNNGKSYLVFHGDIIDTFIIKYKFLSKIGAVAYDFALWINRCYNSYRKWRNLPYHSISKYLKGKVKVATNHINNFEKTALKMGNSKGCNGVICGHIHHPSNTNYFIDGELFNYLNSGDWIENNTAIVIDYDSNINILYH